MGAEMSAQKLPAVVSREDNPEAQLEWAGRAARALMQRVDSKKKQVIIGGKKYLEYGDWQTLASFFGATAGTEWTKLIEHDGKPSGYHARAMVYCKGDVIAAAEAICLRSERNWKDRDWNSLMSMAQTRAAGKALRNAFGWVAELAGYAATPAEEMTAEIEPPRNAIGGPTTLPKKDARGIYSKLQVEIRELPSREIARDWWNLNLDRIKVLPEDWQDILRLQHQEMLVDLQQQEAKHTADNQVVWEDDSEYLSMIRTGLGLVRNREGLAEMSGLVALWKKPITDEEREAGEALMIEKSLELDTMKVETTVYK
jgi:hypothetical protein